MLGAQYPPVRLCGPFLFLTVMATSLHCMHGVKSVYLLRCSLSASEGYKLYTLRQQLCYVKVARALCVAKECYD